MESIYINNEEFKPTLVSSKYYVSQTGKVYSSISRKVIKGNLCHIKGKSYYRIDIKTEKGRKHFTIHRLVYETWVRPLLPNEQVNHRDDNSLNNNVNNLYAGTQKENIADCIKNQHRVGGTYYLTIYDKKINQTITFCPASDFIDYSQHPCANKSIKRCFTRHWFKNRYEIIDYKRVPDLDFLKSVTTIPDECKEVE